MDLSKEFDLIPQNLFIVNQKMYAYGFSTDGVTFLYLCLKRCEHNVTINNTDSALLNTVIHDLYLWISETDLLNFAYDNTIRAADYTIEKLVCTLEWDSQSAISWFKINHKKKASNQLNKIGRT